MGICKPEHTSIPYILVILGCLFIPIVLITITSIYLCQRIIKSKNFFHSVKRNATLERKSIKAGRLVEILQEQVKPTLSIFILGGIDGVLDVLFAFVSTGASLLVPSNTSTFFFVSTQLIGLPIQYFQSVNHSLVYNRDVQEKMINCKRLRKKCSKVIVLHRE